MARSCETRWARFLSSDGRDQVVRVPLVRASGATPKNRAAGSRDASGWWAGEQRHG
jgi:hypothetical protein